jgi:hypothetical protein
MTPDRAETVALLALGWLAANDDLLPVFLGATGADATSLRAGAGDPAFLAGVLRFLTMDDAWVIACCDATGLRYEDPLRALHALPGAAPDWT